MKEKVLLVWAGLTIGAVGMYILTRFEVAECRRQTRELMERQGIGLPNVPPDGPRSFRSNP